MNKKILVGVAIAAIAIVISVVGVKTTLGDRAAEMPGEEGAEKALNFQEGSHATNSSQSGEQATAEYGETGP